MINTLFSLVLVFVASEPSVPDRCAELGRDGYPIACDPIGEHIAPRWDGLLCCDATTCMPMDTRGCPSQTAPYSCEYAELDTTSGVRCMFTVAHYCDEFACPPAPPSYQQPPQAQAICCYEEGCYAPEGDICGGVLYWCDQGSTNEDGTVTCDDEDVP